MNSNGLRARDGPVDVQQGDVPWVFGQETISGFSGGRLNETRLGQFGQYPAHEAGSRVHTVGNDARGYPSPVLGKASQNVDGNRKLDVLHTVTLTNTI